MANNVDRTCFFFLLMLFSYNLICIEGRKLKCVGCINTSNPVNGWKRLTRIPSRGINNNSSPSHIDMQESFETNEESIDAFRPTYPGHSPGVGH